MSIKKLIEIKDKLPREYQERLIEELDVINNNAIGDITPYFLLLKECVYWVKNQGYIIGPGRGSASGSLLSYLLGLTSLDPIKFQLPFKRFLSKSRLNNGTTSMADIDIDYPSEIRDRLNEYLFSKYGDRAALIATFGMRKLKNSLQDAWRIKVIQPTEFQISQLKDAGNIEESQQLKNQLAAQTLEFDDLRKNLGKQPVGHNDLEWLDGCTKDEVYYPGLLEINEKFKKWCDRYPEVLQTTRELLGIPRSIGQHAAGIVISDIPISDICPVLKHDGKNVIAYDKKTVQKLGLIKNDNLSLKYLDFIQTCLNSVKKQGIILDPWDLPEDDKTYKSFLDGKCRAIFQHDSSGGSSLVKRLQPKNIHDIAISVSLNRPGGLDTKIKTTNGKEFSGTDLYVERKFGREPVEYTHDDLKELLEETYGIPVYQEQIMSILQKLLGYTEEESDSIRSMISDKNPNALSEVKSKLYTMLPKKNWNNDQIEEIYNSIMAWGSYGFNKSHAYGYAKIAYCSAYLKTNFPMEWWQAVLSFSSPNEVTEDYWPEVVSFMSFPDVNTSNEKYVLDNGRLIPPLNLIDGVGEMAIKNIAANAPYSSFEDFLERTDSRAVNKKTVINLIKGGALNSLLSKEESLEDKIGNYIIYKIKKDYKLKRPITIEYIEKQYKKEMPPEVIDISPLKEYLVCKEVLPVSATSLSDAVFKTEDIEKPFLKIQKYENNKELTINALRGTIELVDGSVLYKMYQNPAAYTMESIEVCCYGYVSIMRKFMYFNEKLNMNKQGIELNLDFDGHLIKSVVWPAKKDFAPVIGDLIKEKTPYLFKIRIQNHDTWKFSISGIDEIKNKKNVQNKNFT